MSVTKGNLGHFDQESMLGHFCHLLRFTYLFSSTVLTSLLPAAHFSLLLLFIMYIYEDRTFCIVLCFER